MIVKPISAAVTAALTVATPAATQQARHWTLEDQLSIPEVGGLSISADGHSAFYVVRVADVASRRMVAVLRRVELESGATRDILRAQWIDQLHRIPGEDAWSARIDVLPELFNLLEIGRAHV